MDARTSVKTQPGSWSRWMAARRVPLLPTVVALAASFSLLGVADAQRKERAGREVVEAACASCHDVGKDGAPKIGDAKAWAKRASLGLSGLTDHALKGIRKMPAHGGSPGISDIEIERAIVHMVNRSGGRWVEPIGGATPAVLRTNEAVVQGQCAKCHASGEAGAPKIGDRPAWIPRLKKGLDALVASAVHGHGAMPARGGMPDLSDQEIRGATIYMFNHGLPPTPPLPPVAAADPFHKVVSNTDVYFGVMRAEAMRGAAGDARGIPSGKGYYHLNISLVDKATQVPVTNATVTLKVSDGMQAETKTLDLVAANQAVSYGGFFKLASGNAYQITADVQRPGDPAAASAFSAKFEYRVR